jgi:protein TonB
LLSAFVHTAAVGAIVWLSAQAVAEIDPAVPIVFEDGRNPPTLGDGVDRRAAVEVRAHSAEKARATNHAEQFHQANEMTRELPPVSSDQPIGVGDEKPVGSDQQEIGTGGDPKGVIGATGSKSVARPQIQNEPIEISGEVQAPVLITRVEPVYPETARRIHLSGLVMLQAVINTSGRVEELRVTRSAGALLDSAAISAIEKWIYRPATLHGRAVKVFLTVTVDFALH